MVPEVGIEPTHLFYPANTNKFPFLFLLKTRAAQKKHILPLKAQKGPLNHGEKRSPGQLSPSPSFGDSLGTRFWGCLKG